MALKVKAVERLVKFTKTGEGTLRYVMQPELYTALSQSKVIKEAALRSGVSRGVMQACWDAAGEVIKAWATEGHSVALPGLGTMRFGLRAKSVEDVNDVKSSLITSRRIIFTPSVDLKDELKNTAVQITCYDKDGKEVKRVTSTDEGNVEDPENEGNENENANENENGGGSSENGGSSNQGGSGSITPSGNGGTNSETQTLAAPVISGETPFAESTTVSMSGPDGAEIRYTTDGSTPTAESTLYSEAITLSDSTTVKAIAIKDGNSSQVSTKEFSKSDGNGGSGMDQN